MVKIDADVRLELGLELEAVISGGGDKIGLGQKMGFTLVTAANVVPALVDTNNAVRGNAEVSVGGELELPITGFDHLF